MCLLIIASIYIYGYVHKASLAMAILYVASYSLKIVRAKNFVVIEISLAKV